MPLRPEAKTGPSVAPSLWCTIFQVARKHDTNNYHLLQKYVQALQQLFCKFFRPVGHDERSWRRYELMMSTLR